MTTLLVLQLVTLTYVMPKVWAVLWARGNRGPSLLGGLGWPVPQLVQTVPWKAPEERLKTMVVRAGVLGFPVLRTHPYSTP